ncbi:MAG: restriction endonuclease [Theionarchaea archaeon]|nr:restriction endonuclease [Theionarchaea archaeon]
MNLGDDFEEIVAATIRQISIFSGPNARIYQKKVYCGAKGPNGYQIDISIELDLTPGLSLLFIIECKDHARPIERSAVQQLIQVRDDISAHKAIIVSTKGFTRGAVRLAESNRIALWQWVEPEFVILTLCPDYNAIRKWKALINDAISYFRRKGITININEEKNQYFITEVNSYNSERLRIDASMSKIGLAKSNYFSLPRPKEKFLLQVFDIILESHLFEK